MPEDYAPPPPPPPSAYSNVPPYPYQQGFRAPPPRRSVWFYLGIIAGSLAALFLLVTGTVWLTMRSVGGGSSSGLGLNASKVAVIDLSGAILSPDTINDQLRRFGDDSSVKAIILHINSPGGGAAASQEIYHEVLRVRQENHKRVVASIESVGASGAYYIASGVRPDLRQ